ncbi:MAG TPA: hypothetical protein DCZ04_14505 [Syntrophorhabdus aromaticivorans]|nr:hypothetical protein [Syntrophorhabdus aromaticivorans]
MNAGDILRKTSCQEEDACRAIDLFRQKNSRNSRGIAIDNKFQFTYHAINEKGIKQQQYAI